MLVSLRATPVPAVAPHSALVLPVHQQGQRVPPAASPKPATEQLISGVVLR